MNEKKVILEIQNLSISFQQYDKGFGRTDLDVIRERYCILSERITPIAGCSGDRPKPRKVMLAS